jgi:hypothetical protein
VSSRVTIFANRLLTLLIIVAGIVVLQKSMHFVSITPFANVDDSIGNVAVNLAEHGRYGFLSSPTQGFYEVDRTHAFYNYGPLYFYIGALLTWFFGPSLQLFRMLHPIGLFVIVSVFIWLFRRISLSGSALFALMVYGTYLKAEWPFGRPDIMVSVCIAFMLFFANRAIGRRSWRDWIGVGFFAASAVTTHQIAAGVVLASGIICAVALFSEPLKSRAEFARSILLSFGPLVLGGLAGALLYLIAIDFRISDLLGLGMAGVHAYSKPWLASLKDHWVYAWGNALNTFERQVLAAAYAGATTLSVCAAFLPIVERRLVFSLVMPPVVVAAAYQLTMGFYGNDHSGYAIAAQVSTYWAVAAAASVVAFAGRRYLNTFSTIADRVAAIVAVQVIVFGMTVAWARTPNLWQERAIGNVDITDYVREVISPLPERAAAWGTLYFGLDAGDRTDLVQFVEMHNVIYSDFRIETRHNLAPDFLLLSSYETDISSSQTLAGNPSNIIDDFEQLFPKTSYRLMRVVCAPPYGCTREYQKVADGSTSRKSLDPTVAANDGAGRQWSGWIGRSLNTKFSRTNAVTAKVSQYSINTQRSALFSLTADLPAGFYLLKVELERTNHNQGGFILTTPGEYFYWRGGWSEFSLPSSPYLRRDNVVDVVVDHLGGPLYVSRFENIQRSDSRHGLQDLARIFGLKKVNQPYSGAVERQFEGGIKVVSVQPILFPGDELQRLSRVAFPPLVKWKSVSSGLSVRPIDVSLRIAGKMGQSVGLLQSPPIALDGNQRYVLSLPSSPHSGAVEVGVLGADGTWLAESTLMPRHVVFETQRATQATIVISNSSLGLEVPLDVTISPGTIMPVFPKQYYVDRVMAHRLFGQKSRPITQSRTTP